MSIASVLINEQGKIKTHSEYYNPDIPEVNVYDISLIAAEICQTPQSLVCITDTNRQWLKSLKDVESAEIANDFPFCNKGEIFIIPDLSKDKQYKNHPYVTGAPYALFYAGVRLVNSEGNTMGTLCVLDTTPGALKDTQITALQALGKQTACLLESIVKAGQLKQKQAELKMAYADLAKIAHIASHDLKSPLNNIISLTHLLKEDYGTKFDAEGNEYVNFLNDAAYQLSDLVSGILSYSRSSQLLVEHKEDIDIPALIEEVKGLLNIPAKTVIKYPQEGRIYTSRVALKQILLHLFHNSIKYNDKSKMKIDVVFTENDAAYNFEVKDNGPGIAEEDKDRIFELFEKLQGKIKDGESMGIGLAIVKRLVEKLGGTITVSSELNKGAAFLFTIPK
jgi:signal transduction histidine kinase